MRPAQRSVAGSRNRSRPLRPARATAQRHHWIHQKICHVQRRRNLVPYLERIRNNVAVRTDGDLRHGGALTGSTRNTAVSIVIRNNLRREVGLCACTRPCGSNGESMYHPTSTCDKTKMKSRQQKAEHTFDPLTTQSRSALTATHVIYTPYTFIRRRMRV